LAEHRRECYVPGFRKSTPVHSRNERISCFGSFLAVGGELGASEEQQLRNYMKILGIQFGLLMNFQHPGRKQGKTRLEIRDIAAE
jgi:hypothetical protein